MVDNKQPNIVFIMSDDHAAHAMSCYDSKINETPNLDRIANEGMRFDNCFCTNSICAPSRATILTGQYNHENGVRTLGDTFDSRKPTIQRELRENGYQTALIGKWHLGHGDHHDPADFDYWHIFPGQGDYHDPFMIEMGEERSEEHTSELQSRDHLVCRLLLEKRNNKEAGEETDPYADKVNDELAKMAQTCTRATRRGGQTLR